MNNAPEVIETGVLEVFVTDISDDPRDCSSVWVFGRQRGNNASCAINVKNIPITAYAVPKKQNMSEEEERAMMAEIQQRISRDGTFTIAAGNRGIEMVERNYVFGHTDVPRGLSRFAKLQLYRTRAFDGENAAINSGGATYTRIIGATMSPVTSLVVNCGIKGPEWLHIRGAIPRTTHRGTWCQNEYEVETMQCLRTKRSDNSDGRPVADPPLHLLEVDVRTDANRTAITMVTTRRRIACLSNLREQGKDGSVTCKVFKNAVESVLIDDVMSEIGASDADVLIGDRVDEFITGHLVKRATALGRENRLSKTRTSSRGLVVCDVGRVTGELVSDPIRSNSLADIANVTTGGTEMPWVDLVRDGDEVCNRVLEGDDLQDRETIGTKTLDLAWSLLCAHGVLSLTRDIADITGHIWSHTLNGRRVEQIDYMLMHEFNRHNYVLPDKQYQRANQGAAASHHKTSAYEGATVLQPSIGLHRATLPAIDSEDGRICGLIAIMDFASMYPNIIIRNKLCLSNGTKSQPVLPPLLSALVTARADVRSFMRLEKDKCKLAAFEVRQKALKLVCNSVYGCLGASWSIFCDKTLAARVTSIGRSMLATACDVVKEHGHRVIYGDSDSLVVPTYTIEQKQAVEVVRKLVKGINTACDTTDGSPQEKRAKTTTGDGSSVVNNVTTVGISLERLCGAMLILSKKKYATIGPDVQHDTPRIKGIDIVRRDWCPLVCDAGRAIVTMLLRDQSVADIAQVVKNTIGAIRKTQPLFFPDTGRPNIAYLSQFLSVQCLRNDPSQYGPSATQFHVRAAKSALPRRVYKRGDFVQYIVCGSGPSVTPIDPWSASSERLSSLAINREWYVTQQLRVITERVCSPALADVNGFIRSLFGLADAAEPAAAAMADYRLALSPSVDRRPPTSCDLANIITHLSKFDLAPLITRRRDEFASVMPPFLIPCTSCDATVNVLQTLSTAKHASTLFVCRACNNSIDCSSLPRYYTDYVAKFLSSDVLFCPELMIEAMFPDGQLAQWENDLFDAFTEAAISSSHRNSPKLIFSDIL